MKDHIILNNLNWNWSQFKEPLVIPKSIFKKKFVFGGEGRIYKYRYKSNIFAIKAIPIYDTFQKSIFRRVKVLGRVFKKIQSIIDSKIFHQVVHAGLPHFQGFAQGKDFDPEFVMSKTVYLFAFPYILGQSLNEVLNNDETLSTKRKKLAKQLIEMLVALEKAGIVHADLFPSNFIIDHNHRAYLIDMMGAGIKGLNKGWIWPPFVRGKPDIWPLPPEITEKKNPTFESDRWVGGFLIFYVLTGLKTPFPFVKRVDLSTLRKLCDWADTRKVKWPPVSNNKVNNFHALRKYQTIKKFTNFMDNNFPQSKSNYQNLLHTTYISGFSNQMVRPNFMVVRSCLKKIMEWD